MFSYIKEHWLIYLIGAAIAVALGFSASYMVGVMGSTPVAVREERHESEQARADELNNINEDLNDYTGESVEPSEGEATE